MSSQVSQESFIEVDYRPVPSATDLLSSDPIPGYDATQHIHHVVLYLPTNAPSAEAGANERVRFIDNWLNSTNFSKIRGALSLGDPSHPSSYTWPERGWTIVGGAQVRFDLEVNASLQKYGRAILARKQTFEQAIRLQRRLSSEFCGFLTSVLVMPYQHISSLVPVCQPLTTDPDSSHGPMTLAQSYSRCSDCGCIYHTERLSFPNRGSTAYHCATCNKDLCLLCAYIKFNAAAECKVIAGHLVGTRATYPPQEAALEASRRPVGAAFGGPDLGAAFTELGLSVTPEQEASLRSTFQFVPPSSGPPSASGFSDFMQTVMQDPSAVQATMQLGAQAFSDPNHPFFRQFLADFPQLAPLIQSPEVRDALRDPARMQQATQQAGAPQLEQMMQQLLGGGTGGILGMPQQNVKPRTKQSVIDALTRDSYDPEVNKRDDTCPMCQELFVEGDSIIHLPCSHVFHGDGKIASGDEGVCPSKVTKWLEQSHECPVCRHKLEADVPEGLQHPRWQCPLCDENITAQSCPTCQYSYNAYLLSARDTFFNKVEDLFLEVTKFRMSINESRAEAVGTTSTASAAGGGGGGGGGEEAEVDANVFNEARAQETFKAMRIKQLIELIDQRKLDRTGLSEKSELVKVLVDDARKANITPSIMVDDGKAAAIRGKIENLLQSADMQRLIRNGWQLLAPIKLILERNLANHLGENPSDFIVGIDNNSAGLIRILIMRLIKKNSEVYPSDIAAAKLAVPAAPPPMWSPPRSEWVCTLCAAINIFEESGSVVRRVSNGCRNCPASFGASMKRSDPENKPLFVKACELASRGFDLTLRVNSGSIEESEKSSIRSALKADITEFLDSTVFTTLNQNRGFVVKRHLRAFYSRILRYKTDFPFEAEAFLDTNSVAAYANYIHEIRELVSSNPAFKDVFVVDKPNAQCVQNGESFENLSEQRYRAPEGSNASRLLEVHKDIFMLIAKNIAFGTTDVLWQQIDTFLDIVTNQMLFPIKLACVAMKSGVTDLQTLVQNNDPNTQFLIEAIYRKVKAFQMQLSFSQVDDIIECGSPRFIAGSLADLTSRAGGALLQRQNSIGTDTRSALLSLRDCIAPQKFAEVIRHLHTIAKNVNKNPSKLEYRRLLKDKETFKEYAAQYPEVLSVLTFMGFVDSPNDPSRLYLRVVKRDEIARTNHVLREIATASGISL